MALTTGEFQEITILPLSDPAWALLPAQPDLPSEVVDAIVNSTTLFAYVVDAATGQLALNGTQVTGLVDSVLSVVGAPLPNYPLSSPSGGTTVWGDVGGGDVYVYNPATGTLIFYPSTTISSFKTFLP